MIEQRKLRHFLQKSLVRYEGDDYGFIAISERLQISAGAIHYYEESRPMKKDPAFAGSLNEAFQKSLERRQIWLINNEPKIRSTRLNIMNGEECNYGPIHKTIY